MFKKHIVLLLLAVLFGFASTTNAEAAEFRVRAGDVLHITVWKEEGLDQETLVLPDGSISFPLIGTFNIQGKTLPETQDMIKQKLARLIPDASVSVVVKSPSGHTVNVIGQVAKPGEIVISQNVSVMQALSQAGGLTPFADVGDIKILRRENGKEKAIPFPYDDVVDGDSLDKNLDLQPGDVLVVPTKGLLF